MRTLIVLAGMTLALAGCAERGVRPTSLDEARQWTWAKEPACFLQFYDCDEDGTNCRQVRQEYEQSDGTVRTWNECNTEYEAWLTKARIGREFLRKKDPYPRCLKNAPKIIESLGGDPADPEALINLAYAGRFLGNSACMAQWCQWMQRNREPDRVLPGTCAPPE